MNMLRFIVTMTLALAASTTFAQERPYEVLPNRGIYELVLRDVIMPNGAAGTTVLKPCASCNSVGLPVHAGTRYEFAGQELALPEFLAAVEALRTATDGSAGVGVFYDLATNRVRRITVHPPR
jgi:hypothetical protein